jgi:hypothetical protein
VGRDEPQVTGPLLRNASMHLASTHPNRQLAVALGLRPTTNEADGLRRELRDARSLQETPELNHHVLGHGREASPLAAAPPSPRQGKGAFRDGKAALR